MGSTSAAIVRRYVLRHLPPEMTVYRGNLTLAAESTVADHRRIVGRFLRLLKTAERKTGHTLRVYVVAHLTSPADMHYDLIAYTTLSARQFRIAVRGSWHKAGGLRYSIKGLDTEQEIVAAARYAVKDTAAARQEYVHLPASNRLNLTRYSSNFFDGTTKDELWEECKRNWFGENYMTPNESR